MHKRPKLTADLDAFVFSEYYYLKEELMVFCKEEGLPYSLCKLELNQVIIHYLKTKKKLHIHKEKKVTCVVPTLATIIFDRMSCSEINRSFFKEHIGENFRFSVPFQRWLKENKGKTFQDAINVYPKLVKSEKIDKQFEYNTYIRAFFMNNQGKALKDAITCWKYKKALPGHNCYEQKDLVALKINT